MRTNKTFILMLFFLCSTYLFSAPTRIMPLGDSITRGLDGGLSSSHQSGYRNHLWHDLSSASFSVDFVGSQTQGSGIVPTFDYNHEGYSWWTTHNIADHVYGFLASSPPDIILLHIGSNDVSPNQANSSSIAGLNRILNEIDRYEQTYNHPIRVILATIIPRTTYHQTLRTYNQNLINLANTRIANNDKITLVNMESGAGLNGNDYADSVHPDSSGYDKMSNVWFNTLKNILPPPPPPIPLMPTQTATSSITDNSAVLSWQDNATNETGFKIYQANTLIATVDANVTSYTVTNLLGNTSYSYAIKSYNDGGESASSVVFFTTKYAYGWLPAIYHVILN